MNFLKRAFLSVKARKGKSLLQIFIFSVICILVLSGLSIQSAANKSSELARQKLGVTVTLQVDMEKLRAQQQSSETRVRFQPAPIPTESASGISSYSQVKGYNFYSSTMGVAADFEPIENEETTDEETSETSGQGFGGKMPGGNMLMNADTSIQGVAFTDSAEDFMNSISSLTEGRHITEEDLGTNVALIEKTLAEQNQLKVGDTITLQSPGDGTISLELEIVGIYETTSTGSDQSMNFAALNPFNRLYVPYSTAATLKGIDYEGTIDSAIYYMNDPKNIQAFVDEATTNSSIDFNTFKLDANDQLYQQMVGPIQNVAAFSGNVVYLVTIAGAIILGLIVMLSIRERKYEMGVLLAIGEKRWKLIGQFIAEILVVAVFALGISAFSGNIVANQISGQLLKQELSETTDTASTPASFRGRGMGPGMERVQENVDPVDELDIYITKEDMGMLTMIGILIAIISALLPSLSILRLQPKTILTKQD